MTKQVYITLLAAVFASLSATAVEQADTTRSMDRNVTVERDYKPTIQEAQKISAQPAIIEETQESVPVQYSTYSHVVAPTHNVTLLGAQPKSFTPTGMYNGYVRGGFGHSSTLFDMEYKINDGKSSILNTYVHHSAEWGKRTWSDSRLGIDYKHVFSSTDVYFGVEGCNKFYTRRYGYEGFDFKQDNTSLWRASANVGVRSNTSKSPVTYDFNLAYGLLGAGTPTGPTIEHQARVKLDLDYAIDRHHVGFRLGEQNYFIQTKMVADSLFDPRFAVRLEPYYGYRGNRVQLHAGVNFDLNYGRGKQFSTVDQLCFAPSPNVSFEAQIAPKWLTVYATAEGRLANGTLSSYMASMPYRLLQPGIVSHHLASYTPIDANLGFRIKPAPSLLVELHGGYALHLNQSSLIGNDTTGLQYNLKDGTSVQMKAGDFAYVYSDYSCGKVGALADYHYRDIFSFRLWGDYYIWQALRHEVAGSVDAATGKRSGYTYADGSTIAMDSATVYDRAKWQVGLRLDGRIDQHWSLYSDNRVMGSRTVMTTSGEKTLKPTIDINLGCKWEGAVGRKNHIARRSGRELPNLEAFLQIDNLIHRHNDYYYGYQASGIQVLVGAGYKF